MAGEGASGARGDADGTRTGFASDGHPFGPGDGLWLGGVEIPGAPRLHGHSDGDAALHAIAGALLGAVALGDLGGLHPADERTPRGVASADLLRDVTTRLAAEGWGPRSVDLTIRAARPMLAEHLPAMRRAIAEVLGLDVGRRERQGFDGQPLGRRRGAGGSSRPRPSQPWPGWVASDELRLQDTLTGETRPLEPIEPGRVGIYSCGPTVYGPAHIGNFRSFLFADVLVRHLRRQGLAVTWVMNVTDVDDKIIRGAAEAGISIAELAERWLERFHADARALRMTTPDVLPRATEHIEAMVALIETLLEKGHAYRTD